MAAWWAARISSRRGWSRGSRDGCGSSSVRSDGFSGGVMGGSWERCSSSGAAVRQRARPPLAEGGRRGILEDLDGGFLGRGGDRGGGQWDSRRWGVGGGRIAGHEVTLAHQG